MEVQKQFGNKLPEKPDLPPEMLIYFRDFEILSSFRSYTDGRPNRITLSDIDHFMNIFEVEDKEKFLRVILSLDVTYLTQSKSKRNG